MFDGAQRAQNPMKETTNDNRNSKVAQALVRLNRLLQIGRVQDTNEIDKERKNSTEIRNDFVCHQYRLLDGKRQDLVLFFANRSRMANGVSRKGRLIDALLSEDGDCIALGAKTVISEVVFKGKNTGVCTIYWSREIFQRDSAGSGRWINHKAELAAFLGTDYNKSICGTGAKSVK